MTMFKSKDICYELFYHQSKYVHDIYFFNNTISIKAENNKSPKEFYNNSEGSY